MNILPYGKWSVGIALGFLSCFSSLVLARPSAVTYTFEGAGRFGDCVMIYCKAQYYAHENGYTLLYKPFKFSDELKLHYCQTYWTQDLENEFKYKKRVTCSLDVDAQSVDTLFIVDIFTSLADSAPRQTHKRTEPIDHWINLFADEIFLMMQKDPEYKAIIKDMLTPYRTLTHQALPQGYITVAVHVRKGGGVDGNLLSQQLYTEYKRTGQKIFPVNYWIADCACPLRFPPNQFYIDQLNNLSELVNHYPLYVQIFTDDADPQQLLRCFQEHCHRSIVLTLGTADIWWNRTIEDAVNMSLSDCLIRPCSFFSGVAQLMGDHKLIIRPDDFCWDEQKLYIIDTVFTINCDNTIKTMRIAYEQRNDPALKDAVCNALCGAMRGD
jgi:hypothetical protein